MTLTQVTDRTTGGFDTFCETAPDVVRRQTLGPAMLHHYPDLSDVNQRCRAFGCGRRLEVVRPVVHFEAEEGITCRSP